MSDFILNTKTGFKRRFLTETDIGNKKVKLKIKNSSQEASQEVELKEVTMPLYVKPQRKNCFHEIFTHHDLESNSWLDPYKTLGREERDFRGEVQEALLEKFMPYINKNPTDDLVEEDWAKLIEWISRPEVGPRGICLIEGMEESKRSLVSSILTHRQTLLV